MCIFASSNNNNMENYRSKFNSNGWNVKRNIFTVENKNRITFTVSKDGKAYNAKTLKQLYKLLIEEL